jgi:subtilisin family serine protease
MGTRRHLALVVLVTLCPGSAAAQGQGRQFLVAGPNGMLPDAGDIAAARGTWVDQIPSIGLAIVRSDNPSFLTEIKRARSVALAARDVGLPPPDATPELDDANLSTPAAEPVSLPESSSAGLALSNDPLSVLEWDNLVMGVKDAHDRGITGQGVTVAVVDSGIDKTHPDLVDVVIPEGISFLSDPNPFPTTGSPVGEGHGTAVAGIIAATCDNGIGVCGVAPGARLLSVRISDGVTSTPFSRILMAYDWASSEGVSRHGVRIINASHGKACYDFDPACQETFSDLTGIGNRMIAEVYRRGVVIFASAGNGDPVTLLGVDVSDGTYRTWPAGNKSSTVGSTGPCCAGCDGNPLNDLNYDLPAAYSNFGFAEDETSFFVMPGGTRMGCPRPASCTVVVPGIGSVTRPCGQFDMVWSTSLLAPNAVQGRYIGFSGTSAAAPEAAGLAALVLSRFPSVRPGQLTDIMLHDLTVDLGEPGYDPRFGHGRGSAALIP